MTAVDKVMQKLRRSRRYVFERGDFENVASYDQVGRALKQLTDDGVLLKIGYGLYTKARVNSLTGQLMPANPGGADAVLQEVLKKRGVKFGLSSLSEDAISGKTTQIPSQLELQWDPKAFSRKLVIGRRVING